MNSFNVSDNIGFDGYSYYCRRCGKAGYQKATGVRGHLALCEGTLIRKGIPTTSCNQLPSGNGAGLQNPVANRLQPVRYPYDGGLGGDQLQPVAPVVGPGNYQQLSAIQQEQAILRQQVNQLKNEYSHMLVQGNQPARQDDKSRWMVPLLVGLVVVILISQQKCDCSNVKSSGSSSSIASRAAGRLVDKSIDKAFGMIKL